MANILIIEDDRRVATLLRSGLEEFGHAASVAYDADMGLRLFRSGSFEIVISDVILPDHDGFEVCKQVKALRPGIPVMMLTALGTTDDKLDGFDAGADDYMVKPFDLRELDARLRVLLRRSGEGVTAGKATSVSCGDLIVDMDRMSVTRAGQTIKLTPKEFNLLSYMVRNSGRVLSRVEIAEKVWNTTFDTGTNFIDVYINYLRKKVDAGFDRKLIVTKPGIGFILKDSDEN